jgi:hypothetical protein
MKKRFESKVKPDICPKCGAPVYRIFYGMPMMSEEEYFNTYHEHVIYGGCCVSEDDPEWACSKCGIKIYRVKQKPQTKKECFAQLDEMLSETDKQAIREAEDIIEFHFTLGLWIRNNWLYDRSEEELESLSKAFGVDMPFFEADELSSAILEAYKKHLKRKRM